MPRSAMLNNFTSVDSYASGDGFDVQDFSVSDLAAHLADDATNAVILCGDGDASNDVIVWSNGGLFHYDHPNDDGILASLTSDRSVDANNATDSIHDAMTLLNRGDDTNATPADSVPIDNAPAVPVKTIGQLRSELTDEIVSSISQEGARNFGIGRDFWAIQKRMASESPLLPSGRPSYNAEAWQHEVNRTITSVCDKAPISPSSVRIVEWVKCHLVRTATIDAFGADAGDLLSHHEYCLLSAGGKRTKGRAIKLDTENVDFEINPDYLRFIGEIVADRRIGHVPSVKFTERLIAWDAALATPTATPGNAEEVKNAAVAAELTAKEKVKRDKIGSVNVAITTALSDKAMDAPAVLAEVTKIAEALKIKMPNLINPATASEADFDAMFQAITSRKGDGLKILRHIAKKSAAILKAVEDAKAKKAAAATVPIAQTA
jgi:hypothetical protein